jgi:hypothetical protein
VVRRRGNRFRIGLHDYWRKSATNQRRANRRNPHSNYFEVSQNVSEICSIPAIFWRPRKSAVISQDYVFVVVWVILPIEVANLSLLKLVKGIERIHFNYRCVISN